MPGETLQSIIDEEHLRMLSVSYLVSAGVCAFFSLFGLLYAFMGVMMSTTLSHMPAKPGQEPPPAFVGWIFIGFGLAFLLVGTAMAAAKFRTAWCIKHRKWRTFCMVIAGLGCLEFPYGTALGIFTFIVLGRDSVVQLFSPEPPSDVLVQS
jgi:hypothetical protein